jgi:4'-phosphopantetheinyl transferase EntD
MLDRIVPTGVAVVEAFSDDPQATVYPDERAAITKAVPKRQREFATARACARAALARLGESPVSIPRGMHGEPQWPEGITGSITHCDGYRAAAVARLRDTASLGVDAELNEILPDGVLDLIALAEESDHVAALAVTEPGICWDRLLFCAKESVYKAWFPLTQRWLDFSEAHVTIDPVERTFSARLLVPGPLIAGAPLNVLDGRWLADRGLLATAIAVRQPSVQGQHVAHSPD